MMVVVVMTWEKAGLLPLSPVGHRILITMPELIMAQDLVLSFAYLFFTTNCGKFLKKILKEMGIPDHLMCLLRNLYAGQEATVRTGHGTTDWFQIGKGVCQGCILSPCLFNLYAEYIM